MRFSTLPLPTWIAVLLLATVVPPALGQQKAKKKKSVTEVFHVSRIGTAGAAESRDLLLDLYGTIARDYNKAVAQQRAQQPQQFEGEKVRILQRLNKQDSHGRLFLAVYNGSPSVISLAGNRKVPVGSLSPALLIEESGRHQMTIERRVKVKQENQPEPSLEVVEAGEEQATFFGIPIGGSAAPATGKTKQKANTGNQPGYRTVTEEKEFPKFNAEISTRKIGGEIPDMSQALFLKQLKNGEVFQVSRPEQRRCQTCRGFKRVTSDRPVGMREPDGKMACPECKEAGKLDWDVSYRVVW